MNSFDRGLLSDELDKDPAALVEQYKRSLIIIKSAFANIVQVKEMLDEGNTTKEWRKTVLSQLDRIGPSYHKRLAQSRHLYVTILGRQASRLDHRAGIILGDAQVSDEHKEMEIALLDILQIFVGYINDFHNLIIALNAQLAWISLQE